MQCLCTGVWYCCKLCQKQDWKRCHKLSCDRTKLLIQNGQFNPTAASARLFRKIRLYALPFFVSNENAHIQLAQKNNSVEFTTGLLFVQTMNDLNEFSLLEASVNPLKHETYQRMAILNYLTFDEFREMAMSRSGASHATSADGSSADGADGEGDSVDSTRLSQPTNMLSLLPLLKKSLQEGLDPMTHVLVLIKYKCNAVHLIQVPYVPPKTVCNALSNEYHDKTCIQLNLEDEL